MKSPSSTKEIIEIGIFMQFSKERKIGDK